MAWKQLVYKLTGSAPLIMHCGQTSDPLNKWSKSIKLISSKRNKTDADYEEMARLEFMASLYLGEDGPIIPTYVIDAMVINGAKKSKEGQIAKSACFCTEHSALEYDGPRTPNELWEDERFRFSRKVRIGQASVQRMRVVFEKWNTIITLQVEDTLVNPSRVDAWLDAASTQVGLLDWRPQYGRFTVERLN